MTIKTIEDLREFGLETLNDLRKGCIELDEASIRAKVTETVISGLKVQLEYARLMGKEPNIPFLQKGINERSLIELKAVQEKLPSPQAK